MIKEIHEILAENLNWYNSWNSYKYSKLTHWLVLFIYLYVIIFGTVATIQKTRAASPWLVDSQADWDEGTKTDTESTAAGKIQIETLNPTWYSANYKYRRTITFDNSGQAENLQNFPVMVKADNAALSWSSKIRSDLNDVVFVDGNDSTLLDFEWEEKDRAGVSIAWVKVPQIDAGSTTDKIYMYYGYDSATDLSNMAGVWSNGYGMVQHLEESPANGDPGHIDSSGNGNTGTPYNFDGSPGSTTETAGQINGADWFDGTHDVVVVGNNDIIDGDTEASICFWMNYDPASVTIDGPVVSKFSWSPAVHGWLFWVDDVAAESGRTDTMSFAPDTQAAAAGRVEGSNNLITSGSWDFYCGVFKGNNYIRLYKNGSLDQENTTSVVANVRASANQVRIGKDDSSYRALDGKIDEVRISTTARSSDWIAAQYLSMNNTFVSSIGSETINYKVSGTYTSKVKDTTFASNYTAFTSAEILNGQTLTRSIRAGNVSLPDGTWTSWFNLPSASVDLTDAAYDSLQSKRYIQFKLEFSGDGTASPEIDSISLAYQAVPGTSNITSPSNGDTFGAGTISIQGTAERAEGGAPIGHVDVSTDGGSSWNTAYTGGWDDALGWDNWLYRQKITIDHTKVGADLTDFPVLVSITDESNEVFAKAQSDGDDIAFTGSDKSTKLSHEIELYQTTSPKKLIVWVKADLASDTDTELYMYYGNSSCASQENATDVWSGNYRTVLHFDSNLNDSTSNGLDGTGVGTIGYATSGEAALFGTPSLTLNGDSDPGRVYGPLNNMFVYDGEYYSVTEGATFEGWFRMHTAPTGWSWWTPVGMGANWAPNETSLSLELGYNLNRQEVSNFDCLHGVRYRITCTQTHDLNTWHHLAITSKNPGGTKFYIDGQEQGTDPHYWRYHEAVRDDYYHIGRGRDHSGGAFYFDGNIDEIRIAKDMRSPEWISTEFNNQNDPSSFESFDPEVVRGDVDPMGASWSYNFNPPASGNYTLLSKMVTTDGSEETPGPGITITVDMDNPTSAISSPTAGKKIGIGAYNITGTASDAGGGTVAAVKIRITKDGNPVVNWENAANTGTNFSTWSYSWTPGDNPGSYNIVSRATDSFGNEETIGGGLNIVVDNNLPTSNIDEPKNGAKFKLESITIKGTSSGNKGPAVQNLGVRVLKLGETKEKADKLKVTTGITGKKVAKDWTSVTNTGSNYSTWLYQIPATLYQRHGGGYYQIQSRAINSLGNPESPDAGITILIDERAPTAPQDLRLLDVSNTAFDTYLLYADWTKSEDKETGIKEYKVIISNKEFLISNSEETIDLDYPYAVIEDIEPGTYQVSVRAIDEVGNESASSNSENIEIKSKEERAAKIEDIKITPSNKVGGDKDNPETSALVSYKTTAPATTLIEYGKGSASENQVLDPFLNLSHTISLSGLVPDTTYRLKILGRDENGNNLLSSEQFFNTVAQKKESLIQMIFKALANAFSFLQKVIAGEPLGGERAEKAFQDQVGLVKLFDVSVPGKVRVLVVSENSAVLEKGRSSEKKIKIDQSREKPYLLDSDVSDNSLYFYQISNQPYSESYIMLGDSGAVAQIKDISYQEVRSSEEGVDVLLSFKTDLYSLAAVEIEGQNFGEKELGLSHSFLIENLQAGNTYKAKIKVVSENGKSSEDSYSFTLSLPTEKPDIFSVILDALRQAFSFLRKWVTE